MTVAIIGSNTFTDYAKFEEEIKKLPIDITRIVSCGGHGTDKLAEKYARKHNLPLTIYTANWNDYGVKVGHIRDIDLVKDAEYIVAFWDGKSKETAIILKIANELEVPGTVVRII